MTGSLVHPGAKIRQIGTLYTAMMLTIAVGFVTSVINTRSLGPGNYGDFKFINNLYQFLVTISSLGVFNTGSQIIATLDAGDERKYDIFGGMIYFAAVISASMIIVTLLFAFIEPVIFGNHLTLLLVWSCPIVGGLVFQGCFENILQGDNRITHLSLLRLMPNALFMLILAGLHFILQLNLVVTLLVQIASTVGVAIVMLFWLKPRFGEVKVIRKRIWDENKKYGWHVYVGVLSNVATAYLSTFMISYYLDNTQVGYFSLALTLTMPLAQLSSVVGTTYFKDFAHRRELPPKVTRLTVVMAGIAIMLFILLIRPVVLLVYTDKFVEVASLAVVIAVGSMMQGIGDYFNRFLGAHGRGKELRNGAFVVGIINLAGYLVLIKLIGVQGAAVTKMFAGTIYCTMMVLYYRQCVRQLRDEQRSPA